MQRNIKLFGYTFFEDGTILCLDGQPMKYNKTVRIIWGDGRIKQVSYARLIYYVFNQNSFNIDNDRLIVCHRDLNEQNNNIDNLYATTKKEFMRGETSPCAKLTDKDVQDIRELYFNGHDNDNDKTTSKNNPTPKISYRKLAKKYGVSHSVIAGIIQGRFRTGVEK